MRSQWVRLTETDMLASIVSTSDTGKSTYIWADKFCNQEKVMIIIDSGKKKQHGAEIKEQTVPIVS